MNETAINAKFTALIQQRDIAQAAYVNLCGEHAVLQEQFEALHAQLKALQEQLPRESAQEP
jgi:hypothetical protein